LPQEASPKRRAVRFDAVDVGPVEIRVLGCLIEKQRTTPDAYPLTLNALRLACNQSTNREPVVEYDDATIRAALERLARKRWVRLASGQGSRAPKYRHLLADALGLEAGELAILAVLMLRGPQTPGELKQRAERLHRFDGLEAVEATLARLAEGGHVRQLERRAGQKEERYLQLLGGESAGEGERSGEVESVRHSAPTAAASAEAGEPAPAEGRRQERPATEQRLARLEDEVAALRESLERKVGESR
jgi:uncharacterized protein YceH (UPF0502 family)